MLSFVVVSRERRFPSPRLSKKYRSCIVCTWCSSSGYSSPRGQNRLERRVRSRGLEARAEGVHLAAI